MNGLSFLSLDLFSLTFENIFWPSNGGDHPHRPPPIDPSRIDTRGPIYKMSYDNLTIILR